jgi:hypothetical protein
MPSPLAKFARRRGSPCLLFLLLVGGLSIPGCGKSGFQLDNGKPALVVKNASVGRQAKYIDGADPKTFKALKNAEDAQATYAADAKQVYIGYWNCVMPIEAADSASFSILTSDGAYTADNERVYWFGVELPGADPSTFRIVKNPCAIDSQRAYIGITPLEVHSVKHFEVLQVYGFDPPIGNQHEKVVIKDPTNVVVSSWSRDGVAYYWGATELPSADYNTVVILNESYAKDQTTAYFQGKPIRGADAESFMVVGPGPGKARDKRSEFERGNRVPARQVRARRTGPQRDTPLEPRVDLPSRADPSSERVPYRKE